MLNTQKINKLNTNNNIINNNLNNIETNISKHPTVQPNPMVVNNFNIVGGDHNNSIIVEHDKNKNEFIFRNSNNQLIGSFNILQLFKFINNDEDTFLMDINIGTSDNIITKYIYNPNIDNNKTYDLISHIDSPFTSNIDLLVKLYTDIVKLEDKINEALLTKSRDIVEKIKDRNNKFIHNILIRILKLSNTLMDNVKSDPQKRELILRYSIGAAYKLSTMTQDELLIKKNHYEILYSDINKLKQIQDNMNSKLENLKISIDTQNTNIDNLIEKLKQQVQQKGGNITSQKSTTSFISTSSMTPKTNNSDSNNLNSNNKSNIKSTILDTSLISQLSVRSSIKPSVKTSELSDSSNSSDSTIDIINEGMNLSSEKTRSLINSYKLNSSVLSSTSLNTFTVTDN